MREVPAKDLAINPSVVAAKKLEILGVRIKLMMKNSIDHG